MNLVVAVPADEGLASFMGKKGSSNSITFYNRKVGGDVLVALFPSQDEDKAYPLAESLLLSDKVVLSTAVVDRRFGEALVAASLLGRELLLTDDNDVSAILRDAGVSNYRVVSRGDVLGTIFSNATAAMSGQVRVDIDKAFPVKGIGTVALGIVTRGTLKQHDRLYHTSGKQVTVRSIQSQDEDIREAGPGTRVGVSLKDIGDSEIGKGDLLAASPIGRSKKITVSYKTIGAAGEGMAEGSRLGLALGFSYSECTVTKAEPGKLELALEAPVPAEEGDEALLIRKGVPRIFASGKVLGKE